MVLGNPFEQSSREKAERSAQGEGAALPFDRLAAHVADLVLLVPIMALAMAPFRRAVMEARLLDNSFDSDWALLQGFIVACAVGVVWETFFVAMWGASPGRAIFGLRVVDIWTGTKPRIFHAFLRGLTWWGSVLVLGAPFFGVYGNLKRRPLHDRVADTEVRSRNTRRQSAPPQLTELAFGSLFTTGAVFFASLVISSQVVVLKNHAKMADAKDQPRLCVAVSNAVEKWETHDAKPSRISVALALSAAGSVDSRCLEVEADYALWNDHGRLLGYLAKGLIHYGQDADESDQYFAKVCDLEPDSDSCRIVGWYRELSEKMEETVEGDSGEWVATVTIDSSVSGDSVDALEKIARTLVPSGGRGGRVASTTPEWMRLLVLRDLFVHKGDPRLILQLTESAAKHEAIGAKLVEYRARALWRLDRKQEAKAAVYSSVDALPRRQRAVISSWLCSRELYESTPGDSCGTDVRRACGLMENSADEESGDFAMPSFLVASLRTAECRMDSGRGTVNALNALAKHAEDPSGRELFESVKMLRTRDHAKGLKKLRELAATENADEDLFVTEANIRLVEEMAKRPTTDRDATLELMQLRERWFTASRARRYADWGRALFGALLKREEWSKATEVGVLLGGEYDSDRNLQGRIAVAAWKAGKMKLAGELIDSIEKSRFPASLEVETAESQPDLQLLERIRKSGRKP